MGSSSSSSKGWGYIVQWNNDTHSVKVGFTTTSLHSLLSTFLRYSPHKLVVIKAWQTSKADYELVEDRLASFGNKHGWINVTTGLKRVVREWVPCDSLQARSLFRRKCGERVLWWSWLKSSEEFVPPVSSIATKQREPKGAQSIIRSSGF